MKTLVLFLIMTENRELESQATKCIIDWYSRNCLCPQIHDHIIASRNEQFINNNFLQSLSLKSLLSAKRQINNDLFHCSQHTGSHLRLVNKLKEIKSISLVSDYEQID